MASRERPRWLVLLPRLFAVTYGVLALVFSVVTVFILWAGATQLFLQGFVVPDTIISVLVLLVVGGITAIFAAVAKGFWYYEPWVPGTLTALHALLFIGAIVRMWGGEDVSRWFVLLNSVMLCVFLLPSVRRLFQ